MATPVTFAGNPELLYIYDQKPFVSYRVLVDRRIPNEAGEGGNDEPTPHNVKVCSASATHVHDICGCGDPIANAGGPLHYPAGRLLRSLQPRC